MKLRPIALSGGVFVLLLGALSSSLHAQPVFEIVHDFIGSPAGVPMSELFADWDGTLYGVASSTSPLHVNAFAVTTDDLYFWYGAIPQSMYSSNRGELMKASDGRLYGSTSSGGTFGYGFLFSVEPDLQTSYRILHQFQGTTDGASPGGPLVQGDDGNLYGTTGGGGNAACYEGRPGCGTVFRLTPDGTFTTIYTFSGADGKNPDGLILADDGLLFGLTYGYDAGTATVYRLTADGVLTTIHRFDPADGAPSYRLLAASDGYLYGRTSGMIFRLAHDGSAFTVIHRYDCAYVLSGGPLIEAPDGTLYGTEEFESCSDLNEGAVIHVTPAGDYEVVWAFYHGDEGGIFPHGLALANDGALYGTTRSAVFRINVWY